MKPGYFQVPNYMNDTEHFDIYQKQVLECFFRYGNQGSPIFPSFATIAKCGRMSESKAKSVVRELELLSVISIIRIRGRSNSYEINLKELEDFALHGKLSGKKSKPVSYNTEIIKNTYAPRRQGCTQNTSQPVHDMHTIKNYDKELKIKNNCRDGGNPIEKDSYPIKFIDFYNEIESRENTEEFLIGIEAVQYYIETYRQTIKKEHKKMRFEIWEKAVYEVCTLYQLENIKPVFLAFACIEEIKMLIRAYFLKRDKFKLSCDYSICHFNCPGIKAYLLHESPEIHE